MIQIRVMEISFWNLLLFILFVLEHLLDVKYRAASTPVDDFKTIFPFQYRISLFSQVPSKKFEQSSEKGNKWEKSVKMTTQKREEKQSFKEGTDTKGIKIFFRVPQYFIKNSCNDFLFLAYIYFRWEKRGSIVCT